MAAPTPAGRPHADPTPLAPRLRVAGFGRLPLPPTPLVGRECELAEAVSLLRSPGVRLLTLTGPGGVGKTRLALAIAAELESAFRDGAAFVYLAPVRDPGLLVPTIAQALGVRDAPGNGLRAALDGRHLLVVLDNLEQVAAAAPQVAELLAAAPDLTLLATSRTRLRLRAEQEYPLAPLPVPDGGRAGAAQLAGSAAAELFVQRARAVRPDLALTDENAAAVAEIVRRLDGLPLAIELAAARVKILSPPALASRLTNRLRLLTAGARDLPDRQRALRDAIAWSYHLLAPEEQTLFRRLAAFVRGFGLEAAEAVVGGPAAGASGIDLLDGVGALVDASLLRTLSDSAEGEPRFGMLETIREYALEQLDASGEQAEVRRRHLAWCAALAEAAEPELRGAEQGAWLGRLEAEHGNLRAAVAWAAEASEPEVREQGLRLAAALWVFWYVRGHWAEGRGWLDRLLAATDDRPSAARAKALCAAGMLAFRPSDPAAAEARHTASLEMARAVGSRAVEALALHGLGDAARMRGEAAEARRHYEAALVLFQDVGDRAWTGITQNCLAWVALDRGDVAQATAFADEALRLLHEVGDAWSVAEASVIAAEAARRRGEAPQAAALYARALAAYWDQGDRWATASSLMGLAAVAATAGEAEAAARLAGAAVAAREAIHPDAPASRQLPKAVEAALSEAREALGEGAFARAWGAGQEEQLETAVAEAAAVADRLAAPAPSRPSAHPAGLTAREVEVLRLLVAGRTDREIAEDLFISRRTAQGHVGSIYTKLGVSTRAAATRVALERGLL